MAGFDPSAVGRISPVHRGSGPLLSAAEKIDALGTAVFPDEATKPVPHVRVHKAGDDVSLAVRYPSLAVFRAPTQMRFTVLSKGDGFTTQYRVPYWQVPPAHEKR